MDIRPIADGGEGTLEAIVYSKGGVIKEIQVLNPVGKYITGRYAVINEGETAVIEMSSAAGITLITDEERNPLNTTTFGVGQLISDAIKNGCRKFIIGIGGSATNDGGIGMLQALGFEFLDKDKKQIPLGAKGLCHLAEIKTDKALKELSECEFCIACDVKNPLCGENGCSRIYGPQKGATEEMIKDMDAWLKNYALLTKTVIENADDEFPGTGAAGGLGFALITYLNAKLESGINLVIKETLLEEYIKNSDIVITGEGRLDGQSYMGKAPIGVASLAKKHGKKVIAFSGCVTSDAVICNEYGIDAFFPILRTPCSLNEAMDSKNAYKNLFDTTVQVFRLIKTFNER